jgi:hypothetical protein
VGNLYSNVLARNRAEQQRRGPECQQAQRVRACVPVSVVPCIRPERRLAKLAAPWAAARWVLPVPHRRLQGVPPDAPVRRLAVRDSAMFHAGNKKVR